MREINQLPKFETGKEKAQSEASGRKSKKGKKWGLWRHWKQASRKKQFIIATKGLGWFLGVIILPLLIYMIGHQPDIDVAAVPFTFKDGWLEYKVAMNNDSATRATEFESKCEIFVDGQFPGGIDVSVPAKPTIVAPHEKFIICGAAFPKDQSAGIESGKSTLKIFIHARYRGFLWRYKYCNEQQYSHAAKMFVNVGVCDLDKPFPQ